MLIAGSLQIILSYCLPCPFRVDRAIIITFLVNDQRDTQFFYVFIFNSLHVSRTSCSSSGETNCVNTNSGSCHSLSVAVLCAVRK